MFDFSCAQKLADSDRIAFKRHAVMRMQERGILADDVKLILMMGEVIEDYEYDHPLPSALLLGVTLAQRPLHAVVAVDPTDGGMLWVITVYEPDLRNWNRDLKTRRNSDVVSIV